jgi:hypothetical protein
MERTSRTPQLVRKAGILGIGLDDGEGHTYITRGDDFVLFGGSQATHDDLRAKVELFQQELTRRGKTILDLTEDELSEIAEILGE